MAENSETAQSSDDSSSSESCKELEDLESNLIYREIQRRKEMEKLPIVSRHKLKKAIRRLQDNPQRKYKKLSNDDKRATLLRKKCLKDNLRDEHMWFSPTYIMKMIHNCILTRNWNNLTILLLSLLKCNKTYHAVVKQITLWNFLCNPQDVDNEFLNNLTHLCKIKQ